MANPKEAGGVSPVFELNSSKSMPALGLGAGGYKPEEFNEETVKNAVLKAIELGYRHIDTALAYGTEKFIGVALQEAFAKGLVKRDDIFVTTKIPPPSLGQVEDILPTIKQSLSNLQLEYVDLYLIHWPLAVKKGGPFLPNNPDDSLPFDVKGTWETMEKLVELGLAKSIGVSNYYVKVLKELLTHAKIPPAVNQIELNPQWRQEKVRAFCQEKGIHVSAWSPIGAPGAPHGNTALIDNPIMKEVAKKHGKTIAQVSLRWVYEVGASALPKSSNAGRLKENFDIWDFSLTEEDHEKMKSIEQYSLCYGFPNFNGSPWRNFEEFWVNE